MLIMLLKYSTVLLLFRCDPKFKAVFHSLWFMSDIDGNQNHRFSRDEAIYNENIITLKSECTENVICMKVFVCYMYESFCMLYV